MAQKKFKKQKLSKKTAKKFTTHRKYYSDTTEEYNLLNPFRKGQKKEEKLLEISKKQQEKKLREKERQEQQEEQEIIDELGITEHPEELYDIGPSSYEILLGDLKQKNKQRLLQLEKEEKLEKKRKRDQEKDNEYIESDNDEEIDNENQEEIMDHDEEDVEDDQVDEEMDDQEVDDINQDDIEDEVGDEEHLEEEEEEEEKDLTTDFTDVYNKESDSEDEMENSLSEMKSDSFESTMKLGLYNIHFNREISTSEELSKLLDKSKSLNSQSVELENNIGILTSIGCVDEENPKDTSKKSMLPVEKKTFHDYNLKENELYFNALQRNLFPVMNEYRDLLFTEESYKNHKSIYTLYTLHAMNHVLKSRDQMLEDNALVAECEKKKKPEPDVRHQGFTKPKVLIVVPYRNTAYDIIKFLLKLVPHEVKELQEKKTKFVKEFSLYVEDDEEKPEINDQKPEDHKYTFRENIDDCFRIGISLRKGGLKLFAPFYLCDIIIASPLGLRLVVGTEGDKQRDYDFLSSIEMVIVDQMDSIIQQNWDHISILFDNLNIIPKEDHEIDFSKVRSSYIEGYAKHFRQTLMFSSISTPEINSLFNRSYNIAGRIRIKKIKQGEVNNVIPTIRQTFHKIDHLNSEVIKNTDFDDPKFQFFVENVLPKFQEQNESKGILIYINSYFDYVKLRNYFKKEAKSFTLCSEYTDAKAITRARAQFNSGQKTFMLFNERFHYFYRYKIKGIKHIVFFGLPQITEYYSEMLNMITDSEGTVTSIYSQKDKIALESIVGTSRSFKMMDSDKSTHLFC
ncbi:putative glutamic acid-rich region containing protein [Tieghemostelium lacteum]|uniref:Putative glutamic acid-rich region containing protein n=1 Tax=Tieghemostelium lacteum TaxID=361077 RepID=A0A151Z3F8_TIELA|nr:putative glutamic acid-rich region containing protein [Tieghemostelium lacteum]|eukprot:KYQ88490.1 putative glutamic acid-rich region containing protein [Tieghemostelium lacteum]